VTKKKERDDERVLGTGAAGDLDNPAVKHPNETTLADGVPVDATEDTDRKDA